MEDLWCYGVALVDNDFNPRNVKWKSYRYHLYSGELVQMIEPDNDQKKTLDHDRLKAVFAIFQGTHDFKNFVNPHVRDTVRTIDSINMFELKDWITIELKGKSFLWHQVRRLVNSWVRFAQGELDMDELETALYEPNRRFDFGLAPPEPLFLMDIKYNIKFEINNRILNKTQKHLGNIWHGVVLQKVFFQYLFEKF